MTEKIFVSKLEKIFTKEGFLAEKELGVGYGVADLVLIRKSRINKRKAMIRLGYGQTTPLKKDAYFKVLENVPDYKFQKELVDIGFLADKTKISKSLLKYNLLKSLERKKYIKRRGETYYFKVNGWLPLTDEIIAIEAKMKDWRKGFVQAIRYKVFANKVYLAIPAEVEHLVDRKLLKKHKVGLIVLDVKRKEKREVISAANIQPLNVSKNNLAFEFFWKRKNLRDLALV